MRLMKFGLLKEIKINNKFQGLLLTPTGKKIVSQKINDTNFKIKTKELPNGIYFLKVDNDVKRFIKE